MLVAGIDVSTDKGIVFLGQGKEVLAKKVIDPYSSSEKLLPLFDALLKERKLEPENLEGIIVSLGPGSFTGLRIGVSLAKGLAFVLKVPLVGAPAFDSWVFSSSAQGILCAVRRGHSSKFYAAFYRKDREMTTRLTDYLFLPLEKIMKMSKEFSPQKARFLISYESGFNKIDSVSPFAERIIPEQALLKFGIQRLAKGQSEDISSLIPLYVAPLRVGPVK